jgi:hypothetical protein
LASNGLSATLMNRFRRDPSGRVSRVSMFCFANAEAAVPCWNCSEPALPVASFGRSFSARPVEIGARPCRPAPPPGRSSDPAADDATSAALPDEPDPAPVRPDAASAAAGSAYPRVMRRIGASLPSLLGLRATVPLLVLLALIAAAAPATAGSRTDVIVLPGATSAEGIAAGEDSTFYAGDLFAGDIFRGNVQEGTAEPFIDAPEGRAAVGMAVDLRHDLLFVAGGFTGQGYVYDTRDGRPVADFQFAAAGSLENPTTLVNDVAVTEEGAWFTDSRQPRLYLVPFDNGEIAGEFKTLELSGPAANTATEINLNGIQATGDALIVAHSGAGELYTVDPQTGSSAIVKDIRVPSVDGLVLADRQLWAVQNTNQITRIRLNDDLTAGTVEEIITSNLFQVPATAAKFDQTLAVVNAKFDTGIPPTADQYEVVLVEG